MIWEWTQNRFKWSRLLFALGVFVLSLFHLLMILFFEPGVMRFATFFMKNSLVIMGLEAKALYAFPTFGVSFLQLGWREGFDGCGFFPPCRFGMHLLPTVKKGWCREHVGFIHGKPPCRWGYPPRLILVNASLHKRGSSHMYSFVGRKIQVRYDQIQPEI